jgi:hypothetical protein
MIKVSYALNKILTATARHHVMKDAFTDEELAGQALTEPERAALRSGDLGALYELGANPYLIRRVFRRRFTV